MLRSRVAVLGVIVCALAVGPVIVPPGHLEAASAAPLDPASCPPGVSLVNGGFEQPQVPTGSYRPTAASLVPGWDTSASDNLIEMWSTGFGGIPSHTGNQFVELNANEESTLFQDVATTPGQTLTWSLAHRGRYGEDVMRVLVGAPEGELTPAGPDIRDARSWGVHTGTYVVPAGQTVTRFAFESVSSSNGATVGNFLDSISFGTVPCLLTTKSVENLDGNAPAHIGDLLEYTIATVNEEGNASSRTVVTDDLPAGVDYVPGSLRILSGPGEGPVTDAVGDDPGEYNPETHSVTVRLGHGATASTGGSLPEATATSVAFAVRVRPDAADTVLTNDAEVTFVGEVTGEQGSSTSEPVSTPVAAHAGLSITKALSSGTPVAGSTVEYSIVATNSGPQEATDVVVLDRPPVLLTDVSGTMPTGPCALSDRGIECTIGSLAEGESVEITLAGTLPPSAPRGAGLTNVATVSASEPDPDHGDNVATALALVQTSADLRLAKSITPENPVAGQPATYTLTVVNDGPSDAQRVSIVDPLNEGFTVDSVTSAADCSTGTDVVSCTLDTLPAGESVTVTVSGTLGADLLSAVNTAVVLSSTSDPDPTNNAASVEVPTTVVADLAVTKTSDRAVVEAGESVTYTIVATNEGPSDASTAFLQDVLPEGLAIRTVSDDASACSSSTLTTVECSWPVFAAGAAHTITIVADVQPDAPGSIATNTVAVLSPTVDPDLTNNVADTDVTVTTSADITVSKTGAETAIAGTLVPFEIAVLNRGPSTARGVIVSDPLPDGLLRPTVDSPGCAITEAAVVCELGDLPPGGERRIGIAGTVDPSFPPGDMVNSAHAVSATPDPVPTDNSSTSTVVISGQADLSISKTAAQQTALVGDTVTFDVSVTNSGPSRATDVVVIDEPEDGLDPVDGSPSQGSWSLSTGEWQVGVLDPGETATLTIQTTAAIAGVLSNVATVMSETADADEDDRQATAAVTVLPVADLILTKAASTEAPVVNETISFVLTIVNAGPSPAVDITLLDMFPSGLEPLEVVGEGCTLAEDRVQCAIPVLDDGDSAIVSITTRVSAAAGQELINSAAVSASTHDPQIMNNAASATVTVLPPSLAATGDDSSPWAEALFWGMLAALTGYVIAVRTRRRAHGPRTERIQVPPRSLERR